MPDTHSTGYACATLPPGTMTWGGLKTRHGQQEWLYRLPNGIWLWHWLWPGVNWGDSDGAPISAPEEVRPLSEPEALAWLVQHAPHALKDPRIYAAAPVPPAPPPVNSPYLTSEEAAAYLKLPTVKALYGLVSRVSRGGRPRRQYRFTEADLDKLAQGEDPWAGNGKAAKKGGAR